LPHDEKIDKFRDKKHPLRQDYKYKSFPVLKRDNPFMEQKRVTEKADNFFERLFYQFFLLVIKTFPESVLYFFSQIVGNLTYFLAGKRRKMAIKNLTIAFKNELSPQQITKTARKVFCEIAWSWFEVFIFIIKKKDINKTLCENISVEGIEYLDAALKNNKGVICIGAHFGNFVLLTTKLTWMGYPLKTIDKNRRTLFGAEYWLDIQKKLIINSISARPRIRAVSESLRWLKKLNVLFLYADQNRKKDGVSVDFFNRPALTVRGPAMFHLRTGADILCAFIVRLDRTKHKIIITPPLNVEKTGNLEEDVRRITQAYTSIIEDVVRHYPQQWLWPHKRWAKNIQ
jgi:Kdo2-lipid IVA lauroyltransferase/acyltransferase